MGTKVERALRGSIELSPKHGQALKAKPLGRDYPVVGCDIEADSKTAVPICIGLDGEWGGQVIGLKNWGDVLRALTAFRLRSSVNFFYNLQYDFEGLCKFLTHEAWLKLLGGDYLHLDWNGGLVEPGEEYCKLSYVPKKAFTLVVGRDVYRYFDAWQYYLSSLSNAVKKNLPGREKLLFDTEEISAREYWYDSKYRREVNQYCLNDALLCRELGTLIVRGANKFVNTKKFYSSASVSEQYFRSIGFKIPNLPRRVHKLFMRTYRGGRFEMTKRGVIEGVTLEDIKSAYPYAMTKMPILNDTCTTKVVRKDRDYDALYGAYQIDVHVPYDWYVGPLARKRDGTLFFPVGDFTHYWADIPTLDLLDRLGLDYKVRGGVELHQKEYGFDLKDPLQLFFDTKEDKGNPPSVRYASKINMNGLYGKLIQLIDDVVIRQIETLEELDECDYSDLIETYKSWYIRVHTNDFKTGALFCPPYASYVTSHARAQLFDRAKEVGFENVVAMHTDSIAHTGTPVESGTRLGDWEVENDGLYSNCRMGIVKCGFYEIEKDGNRKIRSRGIGKTDSLIEEFYKVKRRFGMNQAIRRDHDRMNIIAEQVITQNLNTDKKRLWDNELTRTMYRDGLHIDSDPIGA